MARGSEETEAFLEVRLPVDEECSHDFYFLDCQEAEGNYWTHVVVARLDAVIVAVVGDNEEG